MQLVAYGAQDIYLTGQPQITFFKSVYRRHTNFAVESIQQTINGSVAPGSRVSVTISRNGDLLKNLWVEYDPSSIIPTDVNAIAADFGHALIDTIEIEIGGQLIDRHYGKWLTIWRDLVDTNPYGLQAPINALIGGTDGYEPSMNTLYNRMSYNHLGFQYIDAPPSASTTGAPKRAYIPMKFWFCKNPGLAIPLIALQYHEVKLNIIFSQLSSFMYLTTGTPNANFSSVKVYADYVYLDTTERRQFAQNAHEYLIDQLQYQQQSGSQSNNTTIRLNFNHPVKELIFTGSPLPLNPTNIYNCVTTGQTFDSSGNTDTIESVLNIGGATPNEITDQAPVSDLVSKLVLNGTDRFTERHITYFTRNQIWDCHSGFGSTTGTNFFALNYNVIPKWDCVGVYSFALRPEEHQPSGTCNFSRIDTAQLVFTGASINALDIYAVNYNVLRIMSGMGGLAYSN